MFRSQRMNSLAPKRNQARRGVVIVLSAVFMVMLLGFVAFTVDIGFLMQTKSQMQSAADGSVLAAGLEMPAGWGTGKTATASQVLSASKSAAQTVASKYRVGEQAAAYLDTTRDTRFGQRTKNAQGAWVETWGASPYNMVEVTIRRDQALSGNTATRGDQKLPLLFAPAMGSNFASVITKATPCFLLAMAFISRPAVA